MSDRIHAVTVVLDKPLKDEDAEPILDAIRQLRHVLEVTPHVTDHAFYTAQAQVRVELETALYEALRKPRPPARPLFGGLL